MYIWVLAGPCLTPVSAWSPASWNYCNFYRLKQQIFSQSGKLKIADIESSTKL